MVFSSPGRDPAALTKALRAVPAGWFSPRVIALPGQEALLVSLSDILRHDHRARYPEIHERLNALSAARLRAALFPPMDGERSRPFRPARRYGTFWRGLPFLPATPLF